MLTFFLMAFDGTINMHSVSTLDTCVCMCPMSLGIGACVCPGKSFIKVFQEAIAGHRYLESVCFNVIPSKAKCSQQY